FQVVHAMRLGPLDVVDMQVVGCPTLDTAKVVSHLGPQFPLRHLQRFLARGKGTGDADAERVNTFVWSCFPQRVVLSAQVACEVRMGKPALPFLRVPTALQLLWGR